ncbi:MAG: hypothetical protein KGY99_04345 [Phycisphaerae bacterium]|nr:hypothetical protein [Phycisphaerae bacterium]
MNDLGDTDAPGPDEIDADLLDNEAASETLRCPSCGAEIYADSERCPYCGCYLTVDARTRSGATGWLWALFAVAAMVALILLATR